MYNNEEGEEMNGLIEGQKDGLRYRLRYGHRKVVGCGQKLLQARIERKLYRCRQRNTRPRGFRQRGKQIKTEIYISTDAERRK